KTEHTDAIAEAQRAIMEDMDHADVRGFEFSALFSADAGIQRGREATHLREIVMRGRVSLREIVAKHEGFGRQAGDRGVIPGSERERLDDDEAAAAALRTVQFL